MSHEQWHLSNGLLTEDHDRRIDTSGTQLESFLSECDA
jgi:hypothetical protein